MSYASPWEKPPSRARRQPEDAAQLPAELFALWECVQTMPVGVRSSLEPLMDEALEHARFRGRTLIVARDALERLQLDLALLKFDLDVTRRERDELRKQLADHV